MEYYRFRYFLAKKHKLMMNLPKELLEFKEREIGEITEDVSKLTGEEMGATHE